MSISTLETCESLSTQRMIAVPQKLQLRVLPASSRSCALAEWRLLETELANSRMACSSFWTEVWLNHYGNLIPHQFAIATRGGKTCGIALLTQGVRQHAGPVSLNTWHVGTAGEPESDSVFVEYNSLLTAPEAQIEFAHALWNWVRQQTRCDEFRLDGFETSEIEWLLAHDPDIQIERKSSRYFDLSVPRASGEDPLTFLGTHTRANIRKTLRELGDPCGEWAETPGRAEEMFHQMVELHQARWNAVGQPGVYACERFRAFHLELLCRGVATGITTMFRVKSSRQIVGCCQMLIDRQRVLMYQCGRAPVSGRVSPGMAIDYLCIAEALRRGYDAVDFLAGDSEHKRRLSTHRAELAWVVWQRRNVKNRAINAIRHIKQVGRQFLPGLFSRNPLTTDEVQSSMNKR